METKILNWAKEKGILEKGTVEGQQKKTIEEMSELLIGLCKNDIELIKDSIGDVYVTLVIGGMLTCKDVDKTIEMMNYMSEHDDELVQKQLQNKFENKMLKMLTGLLNGVAENNIDGNNTYHFKSVAMIRIILKVICNIYDLDFYNCVEIAYNEIKDRKGKMINGIFVKEVE